MMKKPKQTEKVLARRRKYQYQSDKPSKTDISHQKSCCINKILADFDRTGLLCSINRRKPMYDDVSDVQSYQDALIRVDETKKAFAELPALLRERFGHSPTNFIEFMTNPDNIAEAVELGLMTLEASEASLEGSRSAPPQAGGENPPSPSKGENSPS